MYKIKLTQHMDGADENYGKWKMPLSFILYSDKDVSSIVSELDRRFKTDHMTYRIDTMKHIDGEVLSTENKSDLSESEMAMIVSMFRLGHSSGEYHPAVCYQMYLSAISAIVPFEEFPNEESKISEVFIKYMKKVDESLTLENLPQYLDTHLSS